MRQLCPESRCFLSLAERSWSALGYFTYSIQEQRKLFSVTSILKFELSLEMICPHIIKCLYFEKTEHWSCRPLLSSTCLLLSVNQEPRRTPIPQGRPNTGPGSELCRKTRPAEPLLAASPRGAGKSGGSGPLWARPPPAADQQSAPGQGHFCLASLVCKGE